ncbi:MAG TPA: FtsL-like putative cell division protein [Salinivirgaceae bacterium]|nr:FtsL-like putative cell division protein [Salinivirgaceae bacterium]
MTQQSKSTEFKDVKKKKGIDKDRLLNIVYAVLSGSILGDARFLKQLPYIFFLAFLGVIYIANSFHAEKVLREQKNLEMELRELQPEALSISSQLMKISNQTEVAKLCHSMGLGLKENRVPPLKIILDRRDKRNIRRNKLHE